MTGITAMGAYLPQYRLQRKTIARIWAAPAADGEKAVAGEDEDALTMAVAAVQECFRCGPAKTVGGFYFASTTAPYREKQSAAVIAEALGLADETFTADFGNSLRSGTTALKAALDAVKSDSAKQVVVAAADCRVGLPKGKFELLAGDAAAALVIGARDVLAEITMHHCLYSSFTDQWRAAGDNFVQSAEGRFIAEAGYLPTMRSAVAGLLQVNSLKPEDFAKIVHTAPDGRLHAELAKALGFKVAQVQKPFFTEIGHTGAAAGLIMLYAALEQAKPGDRILLANYGDGVDVFGLQVTANVARFQVGSPLAERLRQKQSIDYGTYLTWRDLVPFEASTLPSRGEPSLACRWRERKIIATLTGVKCRQCGLPQIHPLGQNIRICAGCQSKDDFDDYRFSDKKAVLFTYSIDHLQPTLNPPGINGIIDFEGGGRLICELTDCDPAAAAIGMPVEMTFRRMSRDKGVINYFWKAKPIAG